jgi:hypothetical protein
MTAIPDHAEFLHRACPLCGSTDTRDEVRSRRRAEDLGFAALRGYWSGLNEKPFFSYHRCAGCGLLFNPIYFDDAQLGELYADMQPNMHVVADDAIVATQRGYLARAAAKARLTGGYLEIGPDAGHIVREAARLGDFDHFWLFEPNLAIHEALRAATGGRPATLRPEMDDISAVPDGSVGLAVMIHVLDHMLDPVAMLAQIRAKLAPGGTLMIVTHNEKSMLRKAMGVRWPPFCLQHPEVYNPDTMRALLGRAGFADVVVERSLNYFPIDFLALNAVWAAGLKIKSLPLPSKAVGVRLGNIQTFARVH